MGRSSKAGDWLTDKGLHKVERWAKDGLPEYAIAAKMGISQSTLTRYKQDYADIADAIKKGQAEYRTKLIVQAQETLLDKLKGKFVLESIDSTVNQGDGIDVIQHKIEWRKRWIEPSDTIVIFTLKKLMPDVYGDKAELEIFGREKPDVDPLSLAFMALERGEIDNDNDDEGSTAE